MRLLPRASNLHIATRVIGFGLFSLLGLSIVGAIYGFQELKIEDYGRKAAETRINAEFASTLQTTTLQVMRAQSDFQATNDERYVGRFADAMRIADTTVEQLGPRLATVAPMSKQALDELVTSLKTYADTFNGLVDVRKKLGLYPKSGLNGTLLTATAAIDKQLEATPDAGVMTAYQALRGLEREFMLRHNPKVSGELVKQSGAIAGLVAASALPADAKATIGKAFTDYATAITAWIDLDKAQREASQKLATQVTEIDPKLDAIVSDVRSGDSKAAAAQVSVRASTRLQFAVTFGAIVAITMLLAFWIGRGIARPISRITAAMQAVAAGNHDLEIPYARLRNEVGEMARALEIFAHSLADTERLRRQSYEDEHAAADRQSAERNRLADEFQMTMGALADRFAASSGELAEAARELMTTAEATTKKAVTVTGAAETASQNVQTVAAGAEELSASIREINEQVMRSATIAGEAASDVAATEANVHALTEAATRIGDVINLIRAIAAQTNLLALNATIEAARAGEAGRGFAVVASEVKQLAAQTASATDEISAKIGEIQTATGETVSAIGRITGTIQLIQQVTSSIAGAVHQQGDATGEIAVNTQLAAEGTQTVTGHIAGVSDAAEATDRASRNLLKLSAALQDQSGALQNEVAGFVRNLRSA